MSVQNVQNNIDTQFFIGFISRTNKQIGKQVDFRIWSLIHNNLFVQIRDQVTIQVKGMVRDRIKNILKNR